MAQLRVPASLPIRTTRYGELAGCDFSKDASLVSKNRSPFCVNMISDNGGNPIKRLGWRKMLRTNVSGTPVLCHNAFAFNMLEDGVLKPFIILINNSEIQKYNPRTGVWSGINIVMGDNEANKFCFEMQYDGKNRLWLSTGTSYYYICEDGTHGYVDHIAKRPKVLISRNPSGGGVTYEPVNLLVGKKTVSFLGNNTDKTYKLPYKYIDSVDEVRVMNSEGDFEVLAQDGNYTVDKENGTVTFTVAHAPVVTGQDNVEIDFTNRSVENEKKITKCKICAIYGYKAQNRVFVSGNDDYPGYDWCSAPYDPTYFPDTGYSIVGVEGAKIMGYSRVGEYLGIVTEKKTNNPTVYLRYGEMDNNGETTFPTRQSIAGIGAISTKSFSMLNDEPLFLSNDGVVAITSTLLNSDRTIKRRSYYLDKNIKADIDAAIALGNANMIPCSCEWNGYYLLSFPHNGHTYVLDGRHKSGDYTSGEYSYEGYYWENIHAVKFITTSEGELYFLNSPAYGASMNLCKLNTDIDGVYAYNDDGKYDSQGNYIDGTGVAIPACWATPNDDDYSNNSGVRGGVQYYKTLMKKGCLAVLAPYERSSAEVFFAVDGNNLVSAERKIAQVTSIAVDIFSWEDVDFERFSFDSNEAPREAYFNKKQKKYKRLQIIVKNNQINEPFGIHEIVKSFTIGNFSK